MDLPGKNHVDFSQSWKSVTTVRINPSPNFLVDLMKSNKKGRTPLNERSASAVGIRFAHSSCTLRSPRKKGCPCTMIATTFYSLFHHRLVETEPPTHLLDVNVYKRCASAVRDCCAHFSCTLQTPGNVRAKWSRVRLLSFPSLTGRKIISHSSPWRKRACVADAWSFLTMYSSQSNTEKAVERRSNPTIGCTVFSIFFVNWAPLKCDGAPVSGCKAETRSRSHMIDSEAGKRVFYALIIMLRERVIPVSRLTSHPSMNFSDDRAVISSASHNAPSRTFTDIGGSTQTLQRSQQTRPGTNSTRSRVASPRWINVIGAVVFWGDHQLRIHDGGAVSAPASAFNRSSWIINVVQLDSMMRRPCDRVPETDASWPHHRFVQGSGSPPRTRWDPTCPGTHDWSSWAGQLFASLGARRVTSPPSPRRGGWPSGWMRWSVTLWTLLTWAHKKKQHWPRTGSMIDLKGYSFRTLR